MKINQSSPKRAVSRSRLAASLIAIPALIVLAGCTSTTTTAPTGESHVTADSVFSPTVCKPTDAAAVASIPAPVSGFTGYQSSPGDWLKLPDKSPLTGKKVALSVMGLGQPFFTAIKNQWELLSKKYNFTLTVYDGKFDAGTVQSLVDDIVAAKPDAVAFAPLDSDASVPQVQKIINAGIPVVTYNVQPRTVAAPRVFADDFTGSQIVGCNAGAYFKARFPGRDAKIGIVDLPNLPQVADRKNGFLKGFLSQIPTATVAQSVNGGGVIDKANPAASDLIQAHPEVNVIFGINDDSSLGTVAALKAADKYNASWGVLAAVDGSGPALQNVRDPNSPYKAESGYPPQDFSWATFNLLGATVDGKTKPDSQVVVGYPPIRPTDAAISDWLASQYPG